MLEMFENSCFPLFFLNDLLHDNCAELHKAHFPLVPTSLQCCSHGGAGLTVYGGEKNKLHKYYIEFEKMWPEQKEKEKENAQKPPRVQRVWKEIHKNKRKCAASPRLCYSKCTTGKKKQNKNATLLMLHLLFVPLMWLFKDRLDFNNAHNLVFHLSDH